VEALLGREGFGSMDAGTARTMSAAMMMSQKDGVGGRSEARCSGRTIGDEVIPAGGHGRRATPVKDKAGGAEDASAGEG